MTDPGPYPPHEVDIPPLISVEDFIALLSEFPQGLPFWTATGLPRSLAIVPADFGQMVILT